MDQQNNNNPGMGGTQSGQSGIGSTGWNTGASGTGAPGPGGGTGDGAAFTGSTGSTGGFNVNSATDSGICPHCGLSKNRNAGLEQFLGMLGISDEMVNNLRTQFQEVNIDEYLDTAREYLKDSGNKATHYAKENPGKVAAGVAALALGAGLIYASTHRDRA